MKLRRALKGLHLALGLVLSAQAFLWLASGVALGWFPSGVVDGGGRSQTIISPELDARSYASPGGAIAQVPGATDVTLKHFLNRVVYLVHGPDGPALFDARTVEKLSPLPESIVRDIAKRDFVGDATITKAELLTLAPKEYQGETPVWRASFADDRRTRLYISPASGEVVARFNRYSSIHSFFRKLHMMEYVGAKSGVLLQVFGIAALFYLALTAGIAFTARAGKVGQRPPK